MSTRLLLRIVKYDVTNMIDCQKWEKGEHTIRFANFVLTYTKILLRNLSYDVDKQ
jgi:hypothetical protein